MIEYTATWSDVIDTDYCRICEHGEFVRDPYCTGDSPDGYECNATKESQCPIMDKYEIDVTKLENIVIGDVIPADYPDFSDAYLEQADYRGEPLDESTLEWVSNNHPDIINEEAWESLLP